ncbi:restriction endonuclease subunit S [Sporosarcina sp. P13]|uniref:restriction endonuclease subunit S n=1 Tax=Sporosarcina sp. P13 TaxID=2048263 RepID=UPI000C16E1B2|nr:restriction endonuclease subunit S [Sporosarcina sp. P13]PIC63456.1 restriction endonuclease subunit S [Sporosarcina sp. P13]
MSIHLERVGQDDDALTTWKVAKLRWYLSCKSGGYLDNSNTSKKRDDEYIFPVIGGNGVMAFTKNVNITNETLAIGRVGALCGNIHHIDFDCWITDNSLFISKLREDILSYKFLAYVLEQLNLNSYSTSTAQPLITSETIKDRVISIPPLKVQQAIVRFIQVKIFEIDTLITDKEKLITLLEEKRQAVITEAVTKGLDPNVEMKDSGVDWIGKVPKHWRLKKIKYLFEIKKRVIPEENPTILSMTQRGIKIKDISKNEGQIAESYDKYQRVNVNDFVMNQMDLLTGFVDYSSIKGVTSPDYRVFTLREEKNSKEYFLYYLQMCYFRRIFYRFGQGVSKFGRWRLQTASFNEFLVPVPPVNEQVEIEKYIEMQMQEIQATIDIILKMVEKLREYRQSLIYEAVTGKIDVRDYIESE